MIFSIFLILFALFCGIRGNPQKNVVDSCMTGRKCVPYYMCSEEGKLMSHPETDTGHSLISSRFGGDENLVFWEYCKNLFHSCCDEEEIQSTTPRTGCADCIYDERGMRNLEELFPNVTVKEDGTANYGEFPWMVAIFRKNKSESCGGSLVHDFVVLTTASCVANVSESDLIVRLGEYDLKSESEPLTHFDAIIKQILVHPKANVKNHQNNIALIFLEPNVNYTNQRHIGKICLPSQGQKIKNATRCLSSGWGGRNTLKKVELPIVEHGDCHEILKTTVLGPRFILHESFICAGGEANKDTCVGDGGSPLFCPDEEQAEKYFQAGIVSWGMGCGLENVPGVYVNVALFVDWINEKIDEVYGKQIILEDLQ